MKRLGLEERVRFIGFRKDIKNLYKGADLYVNSSRHEALSFLIIEAMAAGLPFRWSPLTIEPDPDPHWAPKKPVAETVEGLPATGQIFRTPESGVMPQPKREAGC